MVCLYTFHVYTFFFFNDTATTEIYTLSLHDALPICRRGPRSREPRMVAPVPLALRASTDGRGDRPCPRDDHRARRASTPTLPPAVGDGERGDVRREIGRASCRERSVDLGGRRIIKKKKER